MSTTVPNEQLEALAEETFEAMMRLDWAREKWPRLDRSMPFQAQPEAIGPVAMFVAMAAHELCADPFAAPLPADAHYEPGQAAEDAERFVRLWSEVRPVDEHEGDVVASMLPRLIDVAREVRRYADLAV